MEVLSSIEVRLLKKNCLQLINKFSFISCFNDCHCKSIILKKEYLMINQCGGGIEETRGHKGRNMTWDSEVDCSITTKEWNLNH